MALATRRLLAALLTLLWTGALACASVAGAPAAAPGPAAAAAAPATKAATGPLLWRAEAPSGGVVFLLGSVHVAREQIADLGPVIDAAWSDADELVVEVNVSQLSAQEQASILAQYGALEPPRTLRDVVSNETWQALAAYCESRGIEMESLSRWKPWFVYQWIAIHEFRRAGYEAERGVDHLFLSAAAGVKPVGSLETAAGQFAAFDRVPVQIQNLVLLDALRRADSLPRDAAVLIETWRSGEEERLREQVFKPLEEMPELRDFYEIIFFERNRKMAARLARMTADGRTRFVVIGAGHMVGEQSIPQLLAERGWPVARVSGKP